MFGDSAHIVAGIALISLGAFIDGGLGLALKWIRVWRWEHLWMVYSVISFCFIPWILSFFTVNDFMGVLAEASGLDIFRVFIFGFGFGFGAVFFGLALKMAGMGLSYAIATGLGAAVGSLSPLVLLHPDDVFTMQGRIIMGGVLLAVVGVVFCSWAGHLKDKHMAPADAGSAGGEVKQWRLDIHVKYGVIAAVLSGLLNPMINLSFAYGAPLAELAEQRGTLPFLALNVIWAIGMTAGSLVNAASCAYVITKKKTWGLFLPPSRDYVIGLGMGLLGPMGLLLYGVGTWKIGNLGEVIGFPMLSSMGILSANLWGALSGEWAGSGRKPLEVMGIAVMILISAMFILGWSGHLAEVWESTP